VRERTPFSAGVVEDVVVVVEGVVAVVAVGVWQVQVFEQLHDEGEDKGELDKGDDNVKDDCVDDEGDEDEDDEEGADDMDKLVVVVVLQGVDGGDVEV